MSASHAPNLIFVVISFFLSTLVVACQHVMPVTTTPISPNGVIFSATQTEAARASIFPKADGAWTPTGADVARLEQDLLPFLQQAQHPWLRVDPPIWERAPDYQRQYLGLIVAGERLIYANFFCQIDDRMDWEHELVFVLDGGDCYFRVTYKPESGEFRDFDVNGES